MAIDLLVYWVTVREFAGHSSLVANMPRSFSKSKGQGMSLDEQGKRKG